VPNKREVLMYVSHMADIACLIRMGADDFDAEPLRA